MTDLVEAGHIYEHHGWWPYKTPWQPDLARCRASVSDVGMGCSFHQCSRKVKTTRTVNHKGKVVDLGYCTTHDPVRVKEKNDKWRADFDAKQAAEKRAYTEKKNLLDCGKAAIEALRQIAAGHNDPRSLAIEILDMHNMRDEHAAAIRGLGEP